MSVFNTSFVEETEIIWNTDFMEFDSSPSNSPSHESSDSDNSFSPIRSDMCFSPLSEEDLLSFEPDNKLPLFINEPPVLTTQPSDSKKLNSEINWDNMSLDINLELTENVFAPASFFEAQARPLDVSGPRSFALAPTLIGVSTPSRVLGEVNLSGFQSNQRLDSTSTLSSSSSSMPVCAPIAPIASVAPVAPVAATAPVAPLLPSNEEADLYSFHECKKCVAMIRQFAQDPKCKLAPLSFADQVLTDEMYRKYLEQSQQMTTAEKASHVDLFFKLRDIKALRKMVGIHNKYHEVDTKPSNVESTTRLLGQKYILTRVCVEDSSIPFRAFLKAKKAAGRSKPSRSARQAHTKDAQAKTRAARYSPY